MSISTVERIAFEVDAWPIRTVFLRPFFCCFPSEGCSQLILRSRSEFGFAPWWGSLDPDCQPVCLRVDLRRPGWTTEALTWPMPSQPEALQSLPTDRLIIVKTVKNTRCIVFEGHSKNTNLRTPVRLQNIHAKFCLNLITPWVDILCI